ncbi:hypothetical protein PV327_009996 [Microctonus hyperodae]|uniref:Uncharacterized protein n=1 Tax=Microctonus hyperodae TaxID=165561 RepID=A0AA39F248_MICHY|nr:hypothetical protein PV327_009996 [Microctonus hyperodae]
MWFYMDRHLTRTQVIGQGFAHCIVPLDPASVCTEAVLDDVCGSFGAVAARTTLDVSVYEPLASRCSDSRWETVDAGMMELNIVLCRNAQATRINPFGGSDGLIAVSQLLSIVRLIESAGPVLCSLF